MSVVPGNGDILSYEDAMKARETGVSGIMIARWVPLEPYDCGSGTNSSLLQLMETLNSFKRTSPELLNLYGVDFLQRGSHQALDLHRNKGEQTLGHLVQRTPGHPQGFHPLWPGALGLRHQGRREDAHLHVGVAVLHVQVGTSVHLGVLQEADDQCVYNMNPLRLC